MHFSRSSFAARFRRGLVARVVLVAVVVSIAMSGTALANTIVGISGHLNHDGTTTWFTNYRTHSQTIPISFLDQNGPNGDATLWLGLRNQANQQFTNTQSWNGIGQNKSFTIFNTNNVFIPPIVFAINGRMGACGIFCDDDFSGLLDY